MRLGVGALFKNLGRVQIWGSQPPGCASPKKVALGYDVGKISAGCLVISNNLYLFAE